MYRPRDIGTDDPVLADLVVMVDAALHLERCSTRELSAVTGDGRRGARRLREALALADARSESPGETLLRLVHVLADVPVEPQAILRDDGGVEVARADLLLVGTRTLHEYDGADHALGRSHRPSRVRPWHDLDR